MKYTKSAIGLLNARYRSVLKKCLLINLGLFALTAVTATPAMAEEFDEDVSIDGNLDVSGNAVVRTIVAATASIYDLSVGTLSDNNFSINGNTGGVHIGSTLKANLQTALEIPSSSVIGSQTTPWDDETPLAGKTIGADDTTTDITVVGGLDLLNTAVASNTDAIDILNGDENTDGSVAKAIADSFAGKTKLSDYGITNAYTRNQINTKLELKADIADLADVAFSGAAEDVEYDGTTSGLTATTVQDAIDEVVGGLVMDADATSSAGYEAGDAVNSALTAVDGALATAEGDIAQNASDISDIQTAIGDTDISAIGSTITEAIAQNGSDISDLSDRVDAAESDISDINDAIGDTDISTIGSTITEAIAQNGSDISDLSDRMDTAEGEISDLGDRMDTAEGEISDLGDRMDTAEGEISDLGDRMDTAEGEISDLGDRMDTAEGEISDLGDRMDTAESDISDLQGIVGDAQDTAATTGLLAGETIGDSISLVDAIDTVAQSAAGLDEDNTFTGSNTFAEAIVAEGGIDFGTSGFGIDGDGAAMLGSLDVDGDASVGGALDVAGGISGADITASGSLIGDALEIANDASIGGDLGVGGDATIGGDLGVTGDISGADITASGSLIGDALEIANDASIGGDLGVGGDATIGGDLGVTGDISGADITASGSLIGDALEIANDASIGGDLGVGGDATIGGDLGVTGDISGADITASGSLIGNALEITTDASIGGDLGVGGEISGATLDIADSKFTVNENGGFRAANGKFTVNKYGGVTAAGGDFKIDKDGNTTVGGDLDVVGGTTIGGDLDVTGDISGADITASGSLIGDALEITTDASIGGDLGVGGDATIGGDLGVTGDISGADITASGSLIGNALEITTDASIGGDLGVGGEISGATLDIADGKFTVNENGGFRAANGKFTVNKYGGVTAAGGNFKIDKDGNTTVGGDLEVVGDTTLADTLVGGDLSVIGTTILSDTNGLQFGDDGQNVTSIDDGSQALDTKDETQLATVATVLTSAENADYTATSSTGNITAGGTLKTAINELDEAIGNRIVENDWGADYDYDTDPAVVTDALSKLASNIGSATTSDKGNIISSYTVNQNLDKIDTNIGDISTFASSTTGNLSNSSTPSTTTNASDVATAINNIDATLGKIHGLFDGTQVDNGVVPSTVGANSNLAQGTTVSDHLVSLDNSVGDRTLVSANADINAAMSGTSVAAGLKAAGDKIGTADFSDTRYAVGADNVTDAIKKLDSNMARVEHDVRDLRHDFKTGMASMAAMTALVPNSRGCGNTSLSLGTGAYDGHTAMALGAFHYLTDNILLNAGVAWGNTSDAAYRMGITWSF